MNVVRHYTCGVQVVLTMFVAITQTLQSKISFFGREWASLISGEGDGVLCPRALKMRQPPLRIPNPLGAFRRGAGKGTRGACAPQILRVIIFHLALPLKCKSQHLDPGRGLDVLIADNEFECGLGSVRLLSARSSLRGWLTRRALGRFLL